MRCSEIINILEDSGIKTAIAAPTGRAAKRITETSIVWPVSGTTRGFWREGRRRK